MGVEFTDKQLVKPTRIATMVDDSGIAQRLATVAAELELAATAFLSRQCQDMACRALVIVSGARS